MKKGIFIAVLLAAFICACGNSKGKGSAPATEAAAPVSAAKAPRAVQYVAKVVKTYPHDITSYTQGLFFHDGVLYESTGLHGESTLRTVDLESGKAIRKFNFDRKYFAEGSVVLGDDLYILTWENKVVFVYDASSLEYKATYAYRREGWGLTTDGKMLIASDGSSKLYFMDSKLVTRRTLNVTMNGRALRNLNELEYIDGKIWANVYMTDILVVIDPDTGYVEAAIDCSGLYPTEERIPEADVLNGIAWQDGKIYVTGKKWPALYEIEYIKK